MLEAVPTLDKAQHGPYFPGSALSEERSIVREVVPTLRERYRRLPDRRIFKAVILHGILLASVVWFNLEGRETLRFEI